MNVTEQSVMLSSYPSVEMKGRQWSPEERLLSESESFRNEARSAEKKKQQGKKQKPRDSFDVDRNILVTETEEDFLQIDFVNSKQ